jgi:hypothetical protein
VPNVLVEIIRCPLPLRMYFLEPLLVNCRYTLKVLLCDIHKEVSVTPSVYPAFGFG